MKKLLALFVVIAIAIAIIFVFINNSSSSQVKKLQKFTADVEEEYENYDAEELDKAVIEYNEISKNIDETKLSDDDKKMVSLLRGKCNTYFSKAKGRLMMEKLKGVSDVVSGIIESVSKDEKE